MPITRAFRRAFEFSGRSGRAEYWQFIALMAVLVAIALTFDIAADASYPTLTILVMLVFVIPAYSVTARRLHDRGYSGWWLGVLWIFNGINAMLVHLKAQAAFRPMETVYTALGFVCLAGVLCISGFLLFQVCLRGDAGINRFGAPPSVVTTDASASDVGARATAFVSKLGQGDPLTQIERLSKLHQAGALTDQEFGEQKAALLKRL